LFADSIWVDGSPSDTDPVPTNLQPGDPTLNANDQMGRFCIDRHLGAINVSFTDGSARTVPLQKLWSLNWSGNFSPHNVTLP
jgi:prepilin-type processing-associated H-X9-DG protein